MVKSIWKKLRGELMWWNIRKNIGVGVSGTTVSWTRGYWGSKSTRNLQTFKTKPQALAYARAYMRTH